VIGHRPELEQLIPLQKTLGLVSALALLCCFLGGLTPAALGEVGQLRGWLRRGGGAGEFLDHAAGDGRVKKPSPGGDHTMACTSVAPILAAVGLTLVTVSHLISIALGYQLVPAYVGVDPAGQATPAATADTFATIALVTNAAGNFLGWGVGVLLYAVTILTTRPLPRWIGWLGLLVGTLAGWLGLLSPASSVISAISSVGFIGFFVFMLSMGIALLRRRLKTERATQASAQKLS
jgi:hypothetical protein